MIRTEHYGLKKPAQDDFYDVDLFNENADKIDASLNEAFDATTPIVTLFQAMQPNSILNCVVNQANSVYPSAQGSLNLTKMTETEGSVQFLSSDGKLSTGAFTNANESSGVGGY